MDFVVITRRNIEIKNKKNPVKRFNSSSIRIYGTTMDNANGEMVFFEGSKGFTEVDELLKDSAEILGKGNVGTTYRRMRRVFDIFTPN